LLETARGHRLEALLTLALTTGMRRGEMLALRWQDINWSDSSLQVQRTVNRYGRGHGYVVSEPKTTKGRRRITLPAFVLDMLKQHKAHQLEARLKAGPAWQDQGLVFCNDVGGFLRPNGVGKQFQRLVKAAGLPHMRFHDLRHSAATILLAMRVNPKVIQELLGHSQIRITLDIYSHALPDMQEEAMQKMDDLFGPAEDKEDKGEDEVN
jgi:integrase